MSIVSHKRLYGIKHLIFLIAFLFAGPFMHGQQVSMEHLSMKEGLSNSNVFRFFQDKRGFLWMCTSRGLNMYSGKAFKVYDVSAGLPNVPILSMSETDSSGTIINTYGHGMYIMTNKGIKPLPCKGDMPKKVLYSTEFNHKIWIIGLDTTNQLLYMKDGVISKVSLKDSSGKSIRCQRFMKIKDDLLLLTTGGIYAVDKKDRISPFFGELIKESVFAVRIDDSNSYWVGLKDRVVHIANNKIVKEFNFDQDARISDMLIDHEGNIWIALSGQGILIVKDGRLMDMTKMLRIRSIIVNDLFEDTENNIWIATHGEGVYKIGSLHELVYPLDGETINAYCNSIVPTNDHKIIFGSTGTISILGNQLKELKCDSLKRWHFLYFVVYDTTRILIGTPFALIEKKLTSPYRERIIGTPTESVGSTACYKDKNNNIWVGGYKGLYKLDKDNKYLRKVPLPPAYSGKRINSITEDGSGLLLGTEEGLMVINAGWIRYKFYTKDPLLNHINEVLPDPAGKVWVSTDGGLVCISKNGTKIFTTKNGMTSNICTAVCLENNTLWIGTSKGLNYMNLTTSEIREYRLDYFPSEVVAIYQAADSNLYVGTVNGLSVLEANKITILKDDVPPPLYISSVKTLGDTLMNPAEVKLSYNQNKLAIDFIAVSFRNPDKIEYRYKLEDADKSWHYTTNTSIEYSSLSPGNYHFILNARKNNGPWGKDIRLPVIIMTPFWRSWWAYSIAVTGSMILLYLLASWRIRKIEEKKRIKLRRYNKMVYLKQQALNALINPHFIFNCLNSIQHYLNKNDNENANSYLADFASLIRLTLDEAQEVFTTLDKEVSRIKLYLYLEQLRFGKNLCYTITIDPAINLQMRIPNMIMQPYVENAVWHGLMPKKAAGLIEMELSINKEEELSIIIRDNGVGITNSKNQFAKKNKSYGMKLTEERLHLLKNLFGHNYSVTVTELLNAEGCSGTMVALQLPLNEKYELFPETNELSE